MSPPTWVVWIEIVNVPKAPRLLAVTTHMGGVDWNNLSKSFMLFIYPSPPTWVVWIEISVK